MISNRNEDLLRQEFKRRYLTEFSQYVGGLMEESSGHSANFLFMVLTVLTAPFSLPIAGLLGLGVSARYAQVQADVKAALADAAKSVSDNLQSEDRAKLPHVESWLDAHMDNLPDYLDRLDRVEDERRTVRSLIEKANHLGSVDCLSAEDRALLKRHGVRRFKVPLYAGYPLAPRCQLGNWHFSQLDRALWRDIAKTAGGRGKMIRRMMGLARA
ncbi:MAG: hypothetical protein JWM91_485 [Rhodospirillales bacterium]|nr:hypothetical protein [Rhodospirillales bacterium]